MSSQTERDRATDALLRASLSGLPAGDASPCVDAETLAAWSERALPFPDIARIDAHLADCARCQQMLAAFVRTEPVAAAAVPFWQRWPMAKWLVPAATLVGTVVIVGVLTRETTPVPVQMARQEAPSAASPLPTPEPPADVSMPPAAPPPPARPESMPVAGRALKDAPLSRTAEQAAGNRNRADREARNNEIGQAAAPTPSAVAPASLPPPLTDGAANIGLEAFRSAEGAQAKPASTADASDRNATKLDSVQVTNLPLNQYRNYQALVVLVPGAEADASAQRTMSFEKVAAEIVSAPRPAFAATGGRGGAGRGPSGAAQAAQAAAEATTLANTIPARWRILATGVVERSTNGGATWHAVTVDTRVAVTGGVSPSDLVCWLIGRGGTILLSTDGLTLRRVPFPETADLVSVTALNDRQATVMTADGRTFVTFDGGASWTRQP